MSKLLEVKISWSPIIGRPTLEEKVEAVSSENPVGNFDILPKHINFITLIFNNLTLHFPDKKRTDYRFERGVLEVSDDKVNIFLGV
jgi:F0F1-type ATP synthase epsilon subunit